MEKGDSRGVYSRLLVTYRLIVDYCLNHRFFLPHDVMDYVYSLVKNGVLNDVWNDWVWLGGVIYSYRMDQDIVKLCEKGFLAKTCVNGVCGFYTLVKDGPQVLHSYR